MSSNAARKPSYAAMAKRHPSTPKTKRTSSKLTPSVREKSEKRNATSSSLKNRKINRGSDEVSNQTNKLLPSNTPDQPSALQSVTPSPDKNPPSINRVQDGWFFDREVFDDELDEDEEKGNKSTAEEPTFQDDDEIKKEESDAQFQDVQDQEEKETSPKVNIVDAASDTVKNIIDGNTHNDNIKERDDNHYKHLSDQDEEDEEYEGYVVDDEDDQMGEDNDDNLSTDAVQPSGSKTEGKGNEDDEKSYDVDAISDDDLDDIIDKEKIKDSNKEKEKYKKNNKNENDENATKKIEKDDDDDDDDMWEDMDDDEDDDSDYNPDEGEKEDVIMEDQEKVKESSKKSDAKVNEHEIANPDDHEQIRKDDDEASTATEKAGTKTTTVKWGPKGPPPPHTSDSRRQLSTSHQINGKNHKPTQQDELNSVNSDETTHNMSKEEADEEVAPKNTRIQLSITVYAEDAAKVAAMVMSGGKEIPTISDQIIEGIKACLKELKKTDNESYLLAWRDSKNLEHMALDDDFPSSPSEITKFFDGYRRNLNNKNKQFRASVKLRLAHAKPIGDIMPNMSEWARSNGMIFKPTVIQAETPVNIGWLVYSSSFTDVEKLRKILRKVHDIEWGFRVQEVTKTESALDYKKRTKALFIYVDKKHEGAAVNTAQSLFPNTKFTPIRDFKSNFSFYPLESRVKNQEKIMKFKMTLARQKVHSASIRGQFETFFEGNIDDPIFDHPDSKAKVSLRQLIMAIPSQTAMEAEKEFLNEGETPTFQPLFHSIDFTLDSKQVWIDGYPGPGGPGYVISFYVENYAEAIEMIKGFGVYFVTMFEQQQKFEEAFGVDHWESNEGWTWVKEDNKFITVESIMMLENILLDGNLAIRRKADEMFARELQEEQEKIAKKKEEKNDKDKKKEDKKRKAIEKIVAQKYSDARKELNKTKKNDTKKQVEATNDLSKKIVARKKFKLKRQQFRNDDAQSIDVNDLTKDTPQKPIESDTIEFNNEAASITSSITANSVTDVQIQSGQLNTEANPKDDQSATASIRTFNNVTIEEIFADPTKTPEEKKKLAAKLMDHVVAKQMMKGQQMIEAQYAKEKETQVQAAKSPTAATKPSSSKSSSKKQKKGEKKQTVDPKQTLLKVYRKKPGRRVKKPSKGRQVSSRQQSAGKQK